MADRRHKSGTFAIATGARVEGPRELRFSWHEPNRVLDNDLIALELTGPCDMRPFPSVNQACAPKATP